MLRSTATRGMVKIGLPFCKSDHGFINCSSVAAAKAARKSATFLSNISSASLVVARAPARQVGQVGDEPAQLSRFFVRLPVPFGVGRALESFSGVGHFVIEFGKKRLADRHSLAPELKCVLRFRPAPSAILEAADIFTFCSPHFRAES